MNRGRLIAFEGLDGCGKTTQISRLAESLRKAGHDPVVTAEPTEGEYGRRIRAMARGSAPAVAPEEELRWFVEDRREHVARCIEPALAAGRHVLTDRYFLSTVAYQGANGFDPARILADSEAEFPIPDLVLLLELDVETALARVHARGARVEGIFEARDRLARVAQIFHGVERAYSDQDRRERQRGCRGRRDRRAGARAARSPLTDRHEESPMPQPPAPLDPEKLKDYAKLVFGALGGAMTSAMIYLGDRLGLYRALAGGAPVTSAELAEKTGLSERWLREWLHAQGAAGVLVHHGGGRFGLTTEGEAVLANENHPAFGAGFFSQLPSLVGVAERLPEAFRTGIGLPLRRLRARGRARRRARSRALVPRAAGALRAPKGRRRGDAPARRSRRGRRRLRRRRGADRDGEGLPALRVPRLRHLAARARARRGEPRARPASRTPASTTPRAIPCPRTRASPSSRTFDCLHDMTDPASVMRADPRRARARTAPG